MNTLLKQLLLFIVITGCVAITLTNIGVNIVIAILLGIIVQYALYNAFLYGVDAFVAFKIKKLEVAKLRELSYQGVEVTCPCSQSAKEFVPIRLNKPNYYKCKKCDRTVAIFVAVETALVTEPIADTDLSSVEKLLNNKLNELT